MDVFNLKTPETIASQRVSPGVLVLNKNLKVAYLNKEAFTIITSISSSDISLETYEDNIKLPKNLTESCKKFFSNPQHKDDESLAIQPLIFKDNQKNIFYSFRLLPIGLGRQTKGSNTPYLLILIEKIEHHANWSKPYNLTKREREVINLLLMGFTNNEMAEKLFVSTYTIEDHIKNIMRKLKVKNRLTLALKILNIKT